MSNKNKPVNINVRLKSAFQSLQMYLSPAQLKYNNRHEKNHTFVDSISFVLGNESFNFHFNIYDSERDELLNIEDQTMTVSYLKKDDDIFVNWLIYENAMNIEESKAFMNKLFKVIRENNPFWYHDDGKKTGYFVTMPIIKNFLFSEQFSDSDFEKLLTIIKKESDVFNEQKDVNKNAQETMIESLDAYNEEFKKRSNQSKINKLLQEIEQLQASEDRLKKELDQKYKVTHTKNISNGYEEQSLNKTMMFMQFISEKIKEHNLNVQFGDICKQFNIR